LGDDKQATECEKRVYDIEETDAPRNEFRIPAGGNDAGALFGKGLRADLSEDFLHQPAAAMDRTG
jgi:hypothetical protein